MIQIMIVDDMPIFLEYLKSFIEWESYGFQICCEAADGKEALEKIEIYHPDIILTDITMPYVNGLELAEQVSQLYPDIFVLLITGNSEIEYAKQAVEIGVCDYILKPFEKEELLFSLLKLQNNIDKALESKNGKEEQAYQKREEALQKLLLPDADIAKVHQQLKEAGVLFEHEFFMVCTMQFLVGNPEELSQVNDWKKIIIDMLSDMLKIAGTFQVFLDLENNVVLILNFDSEDEMKAYKIYELMDIRKIIKSQLHLETVIGVSKYCYGLGQVKEGYDQSMYAAWGRMKNAREVTEQAKEYIRRHYMEGDLSIADISRELLINQTYLRKMFKEETGYTLSAYITEYKMSMAKQLLQNTDDKLSVIASKVGYNDVGYFSKCFKRFYGISPKKLLLELKNGIRR